MPVIIFLSAALVVLVLLYLGYLFFFPHVNPPLVQNAVIIGDNTFDVEIASTTMEKTLGLSGRNGLGANQGMLFIFSDPGVQHFWMKDMKFSIDIIWISDDRVAGFVQNAAPEPGVPLWNLQIYNSPDSVDKVLEVDAGTVAKDNIKIGDSVSVRS
ncbi:MAG: DUF192 domain-containing protein [Patescibacteria group bacterium]|nr:DUF192 domain-containing protein [Patescibacteria group bacterium]